MTRREVELLAIGAGPSNLGLAVALEELAPEIAESSLVQDLEGAQEILGALRKAGVRIVLDNFGTGQSSLTGLYRLPFSEIKVDHSLIADVPRERDARVIIKAIVNLAHGLGLAACAEGVETAQMLDFVRSAGFDSAQGRLFCEPVAAAEISNIVRAWPSTGPAATDSWRVAKTRDFDGATMTMRTLTTRSADG